MKTPKPKMDKGNSPISKKKPKVPGKPLQPKPLRSEKER